MTLKDLLIKHGYGPNTSAHLIHKGDENNMYLVRDPSIGTVVFESIVEPADSITEADLTPDTEIRDRPWYIEPGLSIALQARDNLPKELAKTAMVKSYKYK